MFTRRLTAVAMLLCAIAGRLSAQTTHPATNESAQPAETRPTQPSSQPTTAPVFPPIEELFKALASPDWHERRKAQELLVRSGPEGKPFILDLIARAPDEESRKNAQAALVQIEQNRLIGPSYITLHLKNAGPKEIFAELSKQCFAPLATWPDNLWEQGAWQKVAVDVDHKPFWEVVPGICQQFGVDFRPFQSGMRIMRSGGMQIDGISHVDGPFLVIANQVSYSRTRAFAGGQGDQAQFGMNVSVYAEPKITVLRSSGSIKLDEVVDDAGNSLVPQSAAVRNFFSGYAAFGGYNLYVPLEYPKKKLGTKIVKLKGATSFVIQTKMERLQIPDLMNLKETTKLLNGIQITFKDIKKTADTYQLHLRVAQPNFGGPEWQQLIDGVQNRLQIMDAEGNPLEHRGMGSSGNNEMIEINLDFARAVRGDGRMAGEPAKLVWEVPTETRDMTVPVSFTNLPLFDDK